MSSKSLAVLSLLVWAACGYPTGPPASSHFDLVCKEMTPSPGAHGPAQEGNGGFFVSIKPSMEKKDGSFEYTPGAKYTIELVGTQNTFKGFLIQARNAGNLPPESPQLIGRFDFAAEGVKTLDCDPLKAATEATVSHSAAIARDTVLVTWTAPADTGAVDFHYTVVQYQTFHFDHLSAFQEGPPPPTSVPDNTLEPIKQPDDYRLNFRTPDNCRREECSVYVAIDTNRGNDSWLDIYMEGKAEGWVGVGFSNSSSMFATDVVACNRLNENMVVLDIFNLHAPDRKAPTDAIQDVFMFKDEYKNGRISCTVIKRILPSDQYDIDLNQELYVLYGRRSTAAQDLKIISPHDFGDHVPEISSDKINAVTANRNGSSSDFNLIRSQLIKAHGILMLITWPVLVVTAVLFPVFMKPAFQGGGWFQIHRAMMVLSVCTGIAGFACIFVAQKNQAIPGLMPMGSDDVPRTLHFSAGVLLMTLQLLNPLISMLRCKPESSHRWIYNLIHGRIVGMVAIFLAMVNTGIGAWLLTSSLNPVFIAVEVWNFIFLFTIFYQTILYTIIAAVKGKRELAPSIVQCLFGKKSNSSDLNKPGDEKSPLISINSPEHGSKRNWYRWLLLILFLAISLLIQVAAMVFIAIRETS